MKHEFTGVFIPAKIWLSTELIPAEKMLLGEIEALSQRYGYCDASRAHFAKWLNCTVQNITYFMAKLERMGFITIEKKVGLRSKIRVVSERFYEKDSVNKVDSTRQSGLLVPDSPVYGGGKRDLPEIKEKRKEENTINNTTSQFDEWLSDLKTDPFIRETFTRARRVPAALFASYVDLFELEARTKPETYHKRADVVNHFLSYSQRKYEIEAKPQGSTRPQFQAERSASDDLPRISQTVKYRDGK